MIDRLDRWLSAKEAESGSPFPIGWIWLTWAILAWSAYCVIAATWFVLSR